MIRRLTSKYSNVITIIIAIILILVPFHAFFTVWGSSLTGHYTTWRLWDEALLIVATFLTLALIYQAKLWNKLAQIHVFWLIVVYGLLQIALGISSYLRHDVTAKALGYGWIVDLRFLLFFLICLVIASKSNWLKEHWRQLLLIPAAIVVLFGLLQYFVLPYDFLKHFGYSVNTILPYETINHNLHYLRIISTLRGANPLGAYLVIVTCALSALFLKSKDRKERLTYGSLGIATAGSLYLSFSRSAWIGVVLGVLLIVIVNIKNAKTRRNIVVGLVSLAIILGLTSAALKNNTRFENIITHTQHNSAIKTTSDQGHISALKSGLKDVIHQPLGRGPGTAGPASLYNNHPARIAENYFVQIAQEVGWLGLILFVLILWLIIKELWLSRSDTLSLVLLASLIGITFINLLSHAWVDDTLSYIWWGLAGIALSPALKNYAKKGKM